MSHSLVSCEEALAHLDDPDWILIDCRTRLGEAQWGHQRHAEGHIPGAHFLDMETDLSDPVGDGSRGRHPLPDPARLAAKLEAIGVTPRSQIVCYDHEGGWWASRAWWLCRAHGLSASLLDGGWTRWQILGLPVEQGEPKERRGHGVARRHTMPVVAADSLDELAGRRLFDARAPERYRGDVEPVDKMAGHIPGARNLPFAQAVGTDGRFRSPDEVRAWLQDAGLDEQSVVYCGSGVTATHLVFSAVMAGAQPPALFPGSWSAWCHAQRPVARGGSPGGPLEDHW